MQEMVLPRTHPNTTKRRRVLEAQRKAGDPPAPQSRFPELVVSSGQQFSFEAL
ncbi:hypothetical protein [Streptomyces mirabilis]|uniref:hypothetical protein n=1 Tax=Streptomyces mirabilis TaxID=68239 RepID=UPI00324DEC58